MEGTSHRGKRVLVVRRDFERSRLEQAQLATAYERVLPEVRVILTESRYWAKSSASTALAFASEADAMQSKPYAIGGRFHE